RRRLSAPRSRRALRTPTRPEPADEEPRLPRVGQLRSCAPRGDRGEHRVDGPADALRDGRHDGPRHLRAARARRPLPALPELALMHVAEIQDRLTAWFATQLPEADKVRIEGLDRVEFGHSAETLLLDVISSERGHERRDEVVVRVRPPEPGLLPP